MTYGRGKGRSKRDGSMNKLEKDFAQLLEQRKQAKELLWYKFEGMTFRLAAKTSYTPDFCAMLPDGELVMYETKGLWTASARIKTKVAAELFPVRFVGVTRDKNKQWVFEDFSGKDT